MFLTCEYCGKEFHGADAFEEAKIHEQNCPHSLKERLWEAINESNKLWEERVKRLDDIRELTDRAEVVVDKAREIAEKVGCELDTDKDGYFYIKSFDKENVVLTIDDVDVNFERKNLSLVRKAF